MGRVVSSFRVLPAEVDVKLDALKEAIRKALPQEAMVHRFDEEPIAFGLVALHVHVVMPEDLAGEMDRIEEALRRVEGVGQVDVTMVRRA